MDFGGMIIDALWCGGLCGGPILFIWTKHKQRMAELQGRFVHIDPESLEELRKLKEEVARLRDTTTQYDMTVEHTLVEVKQRLSSIESRSPTPYKPAAQEEQTSRKVGLGSEQS